jgi:hypothetical protein
MWNSIGYPGVATAVVDFTADLSPLFVGLVSVVLLSVGMIGVAAVRDHLSRRTEHATKTVPALGDRQEAA